VVHIGSEGRNPSAVGSFPPHAVDSIRRFAYDPDRHVLSVWFLASGKQYDYEDVPARVYEDFRAAFSKGRFFNAHIRDHYRYRLVEAA
jgi:hypothetical protein